MSAPVPLTVPLEFTISMDYPGAVISKNHLWRRGDRRRGMDRSAKRWKLDLVDAVSNQLRYDRVASVVAVEGTITGTFLSRNHGPDLHNLIELVADAVEEATGSNDREAVWGTEPAVYDRDRVPEVRVTLRLAVIRRGS